MQKHLLEFAVCSLTVFIEYPQNLTNADILGQGNLNLVSEKSGKSQGILLSIICGNPDKVSAIPTSAGTAHLIYWFLVTTYKKCLS